MKKKGVAIVLFLLMISMIMVPVRSSYAIVEENSDLTKRFEKKIIPLNTVEAGNGFEDMMKLKDILKDKEIIGMGEATHGTMEFFQMKHRMFEFLVKEMGYRVFVIEAAVGGAQKINEYILYNKGSLSEVVAAMEFWTWSTEEVAQMISWMKEYNDDQDDEKKKIRFYGMDMQGIDYSIEYVSEYIDKVEENPNDFKASLNKISYNVDYKSLDEINEEIKIINELKERFQEKKDEYILESSQEEYAINIQHLNVIEQNVSYIREMDRMTYRDKCMAENVKWIHKVEKKRGNDRLMIWAHNAHVEKDAPYFVRLGNNLYEQYGDKYYSIAFDFFKGGFRAMSKKISESGEAAWEIENFNIENKGHRVLAEEFQKLNSNLFMLDFKQAIQDEVIKEWFSESKYIMDIGAVYNESSKYSSIDDIKPIKNYDAIIFVEETTAAKAYDESSFVKLYEKKNEKKIEEKVILISTVVIIVLFAILFVVIKKNKK